MNVIPVINCPDVECVKKKIAVARKFLAPGALLHLDVTDGSFAAHRTWADPMEWVKLMSPFGLEVHLMVNQPEEYADNWLAAGARRLIVPLESVVRHSMHELTSVAARYHAEVMISSRPESLPEDFEPFFRDFHEFQVLAVQPGPAGQKFLPFVTEKVRFLREELPDATIEVDGGMDPEAARRVKEVGADTIVSSSYIFNAADPKKAYEELSAI